MHLLGVPGRQANRCDVVRPDGADGDPERDGGVDPAREPDDQAAPPRGSRHLAQPDRLGIEDRLERGLVAEQRDPVERPARGADLVERAAAVAGRDVDRGGRVCETVVSNPSRTASSAVARTQ